MRARLRLGRRHYTQADQETFATLSGDWNPVHVDPIEARRTLSGQVVHGIHMVASALEALLLATSDYTGFSRIAVRFARPVAVGESVTFDADTSTDRVRIVGRIAGELAASISLWRNEQTPDHGVVLTPLPTMALHDIAFEELEGQEGEIAVGLDPSLAHRLFPLASSCLGDVAFAELLSLSRLVGMRCPGRHSLFGQVDVRLNGSGGPGRIRFRVLETDPRYKRAEIEVNGAVLDGQLRAFSRPPPQPQPSMTEIASLTRPGEFSGITALVIGGSRGLGEVTCKLIAAGGGKPIVTYYRGAQEAMRVVEEITAFGAECDAIQLDVRHCKSMLQKLFKAREAPNSIYYFATPQIAGRRRGFFDQKLLQEFLTYYVNAFADLLAAVDGASPHTVRIFCPSSIFVEEHQAEMTEYAIAKRASEELCAHYNRSSQKLRILVERLPRMRTDQTNALVEVPAEEAAPIMLPIIRKMADASTFASLEDEDDELVL
jgi:hypothetical protein